MFLFPIQIQLMCDDKLTPDWRDDTYLLPLKIYSLKFHLHFRKTNEKKYMSLSRIKILTAQVFFSRKFTPSEIETLAS